MLQVFIAEIHTTYVQCIVTEQNGYFRFFFFVRGCGREGGVFHFVSVLRLTSPSLNIFLLFCGRINFRQHNPE